MPCLLLSKWNGLFVNVRVFTSLSPGIRMSSWIGSRRIQWLHCKVSIWGSLTREKSIERHLQCRSAVLREMSWSCDHLSALPNKDQGMNLSHWTYEILMTSMFSFLAHMSTFCSCAYISSHFRQSFHFFVVVSILLCNIYKDSSVFMINLFGTGTGNKRTEMNKFYKWNIILKYWFTSHILYSLIPVHENNVVACVLVIRHLKDLSDDVCNNKKKINKFFFCFIRAVRHRKALGGGMRQCGILAAAALVGLDQGYARLHVDHENAQKFAKGEHAIC